jgi:hypothetical protein
MVNYKSYGRKIVYSFGPGFETERKSEKVWAAVQGRSMGPFLKRRNKKTPKFKFDILSLLCVFQQYFAYCKFTLMVLNISF